jgi:NAD(P)-dependent dehydrogenase (short-subunit alcohol dehydrogenase family)
MDRPLTLVTGSSRGIGAAVARRLAADGHDLVVTYRSDEVAAAGVADELRHSGARVLVERCDTTDDGSVAQLFERIAGFGTLTGLVANAGSAAAVGRLEDNDMAAIERDLSVNLGGVIRSVKHAIAPLRLCGGGSIVLVSSAAATLGSAGTYVHYAAAKAGVDALTLGLSQELATDGIRVNAVAPGIIETGFHLDPERPAKLADTIPLGRPGRPAEVAGAVAWLLSVDASYTTGAILRVAGGR